MPCGGSTSPLRQNARRSGRFISANGTAIPGSSTSCALWLIVTGTGAEIEKAVKQGLRRAFLDGEREPGAADLVAALREAEPIRHSHAERLDQARRFLRGLEKPTIRRDRSSSSTAAAPELGVRLFDLN